MTTGRNTTGDSASRAKLGPASLHLIATGGGPGHDYYGDRRHNRTALIFGLSWAL